MSTARYGVALAGVVVVVFGLVALAGFVPGFAVTCVSNCSGLVHVNFTYTSAGLILTLTDQSTKTAGQITKDVIGWGDGTTSTASSSGQTFTHTYSTGGTYTVTDAATVTYCGGGKGGVRCATQTSIGEASIAISSGGSGGGNGGGGGSSAYVNASFTWSSSGLAVTVQDTTTTYGNPGITSIIVGWGDGQAAPPATTLGATFNHAYASSGTYNITETVSWTYSGSNFASYFSSIANVTSSAGGSGGGGCGGSGCPVQAPTTTIDAVTGFILGLGSMMIVLPFVPASVWARIGVGAVAVIILTVIAWAYGGTGPT